jgi:hypothetical protein
MDDEREAIDLGHGPINLVSTLHSTGLWGRQLWDSSTGADGPVFTRRPQTEPDLINASSPHGRPGRSELAALYRRVADTLERSAELSERHADRKRGTGRAPSADIELERAKRARAAAQRGRALAARLK